MRRFFLPYHHHQSKESHPASPRTSLLSLSLLFGIQCPSLLTIASQQRSSCLLRSGSEFASDLNIDSVGNLLFSLSSLIVPELDGSLSMKGRINPDESLWLPIKLSWSDLDDPVAAEQTEGDLRTLRALSQTCKFLRALALPVLWSVVHVDSVAQLGRLRETLRVSPQLGQLVRTFCFLWWDYSGNDYRHYPEQEGALLDMAFRDRRQMWEDLAKKHDCKISTRRNGHRSFRLHGRVFQEPPIEGSTGPDGNGEDLLIKSSEQFTRCIIEVVSQLSSLHAFGWSTGMTPMPLGVFNALLSLETLTSLHLSMILHRCVVDACEFAHPWMRKSARAVLTRYVHKPTVPYWELCRSLEALSLSVDSRHYRDRVHPGLEELALMKFELPSELPDCTAWQARAELNRAVAHRVLVTAVRGGRLRFLDIDYDVANHRLEDEAVHEKNILTPFAIPTLLPFWAQIEEWGIEPTPGWPGAAESLRPLLAHASLWLHSPSGPRIERCLTRQDVQLLSTQYQDEHVPVRDTSKLYKRDERPIALYLTWLHDAQLAEEVADAWNGVVRSGGADLVKCLCAKCKAHYKLR